VVWIAVVAMLLAGVVALNVAVLRLNVELNKVNAERTRLKADKQAIASQLSLAGATTRIQTLASRDGLVPADPTQTTYVRLSPRSR
jgi:cell division protein FtsL